MLQQMKSIKFAVQTHPRYPAVKRKARSLRNTIRVRRLMSLLMVLMFILTSCSSAGGDIPPELCTAYGDLLYTLQLAGGAFIVLGLIILAAKKALSSFIPSQGAQTGAIIISIFIGVAFLAFSTEWGTTVLGIFGLPDLYTECGLAV
ncbi:MAG: hypothetical protein GY803_31735 [Chloroflexi bacterium]|nr:hypothetical protein [Chloroflexota bacterium]